MDGIKGGSARIYQLFSNATGGSSSNSDSSSRGTDVESSASSKPQTAPSQTTDAVKVSPAVQQEQAVRASRVQELKQQVQSGEYQKQLKNPTALKQIAKSVVEFYSA